MIASLEASIFAQQMGESNKEGGNNFHVMEFLNGEICLNTGMERQQPHLGQSQQTRWVNVGVMGRYGCQRDASMHFTAMRLIRMEASP